MDYEVIAQSEAFQIKGYTIPALRIGSGERLCVGIPFDLPAFDVACSLENRLQTVSGVGGVRFPRDARGECTCLEWLCDNANVDKNTAYIELRRTGVLPERSIQSLGLTPCRLIAIAAALLSDCIVLLYHTEGADPNGVRLIDDYVVHSLGRRAALKFISPFFTDGSVCWRLPQQITFTAIASDERIRCADNSKSYDDVVKLLRGGDGKGDTHP